MDNHENLKQRLDVYIAEKLAELESSPRRIALKLFDKLAKSKGETFSEMLTRLAEESGEKILPYITEPKSTVNFSPKLKRTKTISRVKILPSPLPSDSS